MENPLEAQKAIYGEEDGPPMIFTPEISALDLEILKHSPEKRAKMSSSASEFNTVGSSSSSSSSSIINDKELKSQEGKKEKIKISAGGLYTEVKEKRSYIFSDENGVEGSHNKLSPCQLPGDFPPELSFRALAAYSLLRTLSIQLRLSPFTPNAFLRALYLPTPNPIIGQVHVALLRILLVKKLSKGMGYSYKPQGGGVGVHKRRQVDNLRWPLLAGDNLTNLDTFSWPLFYDDYCHLTADRLLANYHGRVDSLDDFDEKSHFIDFRNIGPYVPSSGVKQNWTMPTHDAAAATATTPSGSNEKEYQQTAFNNGDNDTFNNNNIDEEEEQLPYTSSSIVGDGVELENTVINNDNSDTEDEYQVDDENDDDADDSETWEVPKPKKKKRRPNNSHVAATMPMGTSSISPIQPTTQFPQSQLQSQPQPQPQLTTHFPQSQLQSQPHPQLTTQFPQSQSKSQLQSQPQPHVLASPAYSNPGYPATYAHQPIQSVYSHAGNLSSVLNNNNINNSAQHKLTVEPLANSFVPQVAYQYTHNNDYNNNLHTSYNTPSAIPMSTHNTVADVSLAMGSERGMIAPVTLAPGQNNLFLMSLQKEIGETKQSVLDARPLNNPFLMSLPKERGEAKQSILDDRPPQQETRMQEGERNNSNDANIYNDDDPFRIRGGGGEEDVTQDTKHGRPRGSRRGLPMHNSNGPQRRDLPIHRGQFVMPQEQQQQYNQQYYNQHYHQHQHQHFQQQQQQQQQQLYHAQQLQMPQQFRTVQEGVKSNPTVYAKSIGKDKQIPFPYQVASKAKHNIEGSKVPYKVPSDIAKIINDFGRGIRVKRKAEEIELIDDDDNDHNDDDVVDDDGYYEDDLEVKGWFHFKPLKAMRSGVPYHRLPIEEKLYIIEFLIDELLTVDAISEEFTRRHTKTDFHDSSYGRLPNEEEYESIENNDECAVCGQEGELLCCDGCTSSYHGGCLKMNEGQTLAEGKWLCPECKLVDPCNFGSLHGGRKSSLDWFALDDIVNVSNNQHGVHTLSSLSSPHNTPNDSRELSNFQSKTSLQNPTANTNNGDGSNQPFTELCGDGAVKTTSLSKNLENEVKWKEMEFIIVHGFVLFRNCSENIGGKATTDVLKSSKPHLAMTKSDLVAYLSQTDARLSKSWPLAQIPYTETTRSDNFPSMKKYFASAESVNPFQYNNQYQIAPVSHLMKAGAALQIPKLMQTNYESECNQPKTSKVSELMIEDMSLDARISSHLRTQTDIYNPYQLLKGYILRLEQTLRKSCMLNEFWLGGKLRTKSEIWISNVRSAKSIGGLSRLLLMLVNGIHTKAFSATWFHSHVSKHPDLDNSMAERNYKSLPADWNEEREMTKRAWETTPSNLILGLCSEDGNDLMAFASEIRSDIFIAKSTNFVKSKRKPKKTRITKAERIVQVDGRTGLYHVKGAPTQRQSGENENEISKSGTGMSGSVNQEKTKTIDTSVSTNSLIVIGTYPKETLEQTKVKFVKYPARHIGTKITQNITIQSPKIPQGNQAYNTPPPVDVIKETLDQMIRHIEFKIAQDMNPLSPKIFEGNQVNPVDVPNETLDQMMPQESHHNHTKVELVEDPARHIETKIAQDTTIESPKIIEGNQANNTPPPVDVLKETLDQMIRHIETKIVQDTTLLSPKIFEGNQTNDIPPPDDVDCANEPAITENVAINEPDMIDNVAPVEPAYQPDENVEASVEAGVEGETATKPKKKRGRPSKLGNESNSKPKNKRPPKPKKREPTPRRRTRNSGRLSSDHHSAEKLRGQNDSDLKEHIQSNILEGMALQIENAKKQQIQGLEKLLKGIYVGQNLWPIAGRKIFATIGNLPPSEMKRIARNAGKVLAVNLNYHTSHEVAQVCYGHIWRKRVSLCCRFEELLFLIRILESSLDREMIQSCENAARRGKSGLQKAIRCTITNRYDGSLEHFVVNKKSMKGCWVPAEQLDLSSLMLELSSRRQIQMKKRQEFVRVKENAERKKTEKERSGRIAEATKKAEEDHRNREITSEVRKAAKLKKRQESAKKKHEKELDKETKKTAKMMTAMEKKKDRQLAAQEIQSFALKHEIAKLNGENTMAFSLHEMQVKYTLQAWYNLGHSNIPEADIILIRKQTLEKLRLTNERLRRCNVPILDTHRTMAIMFELEKKAALSVTPNCVPGTIASKGAKSDLKQGFVTGSQHNTAINSNSRPFSHHLKNANNVMLPTKPAMTQKQPPLNNNLGSISSVGGNYFDKKHVDSGSQSSNLGHSSLVKQPLHVEQGKSPDQFQDQIYGQLNTGAFSPNPIREPNNASGSDSYVLPSPLGPMDRAHNQIKHQLSTTGQQPQISMTQGINEQNQQYHAQPSPVHAMHYMDLSQSSVTSGSHSRTIPSEQHHHQQLSSSVTSTQGHVDQYTGINQLPHGSQSNNFLNQPQVNLNQHHQNSFSPQGFPQQQQQQQQQQQGSHATGNLGFSNTQNVTMGHHQTQTQSQEDTNRQNNDSFSINHNVQQNNNHYSTSQGKQQQQQQQQQQQGSHATGYFGVSNTQNVTMGHHQTQTQSQEDTNRQNKDSFSINHNVQQNNNHYSTSQGKQQHQQHQHQGSHATGNLGFSNTQNVTMGHHQTQTQSQEDTNRQSNDSFSINHNVQQNNNHYSASQGKQQQQQHQHQQQQMVQMQYQQQYPKSQQQEQKSNDQVVNSLEQQMYSQQQLLQQLQQQFNMQGQFDPGYRNNFH